MVTGTSCKMQKVRIQTVWMDDQLLARFASRKEMLDGEARRCRMQNGCKTILPNDKNTLQWDWLGLLP